MIQHERSDLKDRIRSFRIVLLALIAGVGLFAMIVVAVASINWAPPGTISLIIFFVTFVIVAQSLVIPRLIGKSASNQLVSSEKKSAGLPNESHLKESVDLPSKLLGVWFTSNLIGIAMLESAAFINLVFAMIEGSGWHLVVGFALLFVMLLRFPTEDKVFSWVEEKQRDVRRT